MTKKSLPKWELARYLIDAKKNVDTVLFIERHSKEFGKFPHSELKAAKHEFCNSASNVLDNLGQPRLKQELKLNDDLIEMLYYERDKNVSHKDTDYEKINFNSTLMKNILRHVKRISNKNLPKEVTLNFLNWDSILFRQIKGITKQKEEEIKKRKYSKNTSIINANNQAFPVRVLNDIEKPLKNTDKQDNDAIIVEDGLTTEEQIQNRQDSCISSNLRFDINSWAILDENSNIIWEKYKTMGLIDEYNIIKNPIELARWPFTDLNKSLIDITLLHIQLTKNNKKRPKI